MIIQIKTKITAELDLSCSDPTSFQMSFFMKLGGEGGVIRVLQVVVMVEG